MALVRFLSATALVVTCMAGCSDANQGPEDSNGPDGLTVEDLTGSWGATAQVYTNKADAGQTFDLIANGGVTNLTVLSGGRVRTWVTFGAFSDEWDAQLTMSGDNLTSTPVEAARGVRYFTVTLEGGVLTLMEADQSFDFTLQGAEGVPATMKAVFAPR